jgi:hypothetical protein
MGCTGGDSVNSRQMFNPVDDERIARCNRRHKFETQLASQGLEKVGSDAWLDRAFR